MISQFPERQHRTLQTPRRLLFTYDIARVHPEGYENTAHWLADAVFHVLREPARIGSGMAVEQLTERTHPGCRRVFYTNVDPGQETLAAWADVYHAEPSPSILGFLREYCTETLVVGFELPQCMLRALTAADIPYLDIIIYPVRFLADIVLGFSTNSLQLNALLRENSITESFIRTAASQQQARYAPQFYSTPLQDNTLMIIGQHAADKTLTAPGGKFHTIMDFTDQIVALTRKYDQTVFRPHPLHAPPGDLGELRRAAPGLVILPSPDFPERNMYFYLGHPALTAFTGLNSSVLFEAAYFGKESFPLIAYQKNFGGKIATSCQEESWPIRACFQPEFWQRCVESLGAEGGVSPFDELPTPYLRLILRGAGDFDDALSYTQCRKIGELERRCDAFESLM